MSLLCVIQARMGSTRLPGKVLADADGSPLLELMIERLRAGGNVDHLVVATSWSDRDEPIVELAKSLGVAVVRGPEDDVLARFARCLDRFPADTIVRLTADCPLIDPGVVAEVVAAHERNRADYASNTLMRTYPRGLDVEVLTARALRCAAEEATDPCEREHVTPYIYRHPERFELLACMTRPSYGDERWTVDTAADLEFVRHVLATSPEARQHRWTMLLAAAGVQQRPKPDEVMLRVPVPEDAPYVVETTRGLRPFGDAPGVTETWRPPLPQGDIVVGDARTRVWIVESGGRSIGWVGARVASGIGVVGGALAQRGPPTQTMTHVLRGLQHRMSADYQTVCLQVPSESLLDDVTANDGWRAEGNAFVRTR